MRVLAAMSGGVDSSVAAALLVDQGHEVIGVSMQLYDQQEGRTAFGTCCTIDDLHDARRVAAALGIPHYILNFERQFDERVVANFVGEYLAGRTPIPCIRCNSDLKFATLLDRARGLGAERVATGHYARVDRGPAGTLRLRRGLDGAKDQSYFLFSLTRSQLATALFPVGDWRKPDVRAYAQARRLPVADKPDSQEICFVPDGDYARFVEAHAPAAARGRDGAIVDRAGHLLGRHRGVHRFTVGQRKGLGLGADGPLYVLALRPADNTVVVGPREALGQTTLRASGVNWIAGEPPAGPLRVDAQIRHRHAPAPAHVRATGTTNAEIEFDEPQTAITPGQAVVFYEGDSVVGGGWIDLPRAA